jgi:hypothetical protein
MAHSSLRLEPLGTSFPQGLYCCITVSQFTTLGLRKACCNVSGYFLALPKHPVFKLKLLADDLESLIEDFTGILIRAGLDGQVDHALLLGFQVNRHGWFLSLLTIVAPC